MAGEAVSLNGKVTVTIPLFTAWIASKSDRFSIETDGTVWFEALGKTPILHPNADVSLFLQEMAKAGSNAQVMVDHLVPLEHREMWRLGMQTQSPEAGEHAVFTPYKQELPMMEKG